MVTAEDLKSLGLENVGEVFYNSSYKELREHEIKDGLKVADNGAVMVDTGIFTGRSPKISSL